MPIARCATFVVSFKPTLIWNGPWCDVN